MYITLFVAQATHRLKGLPQLCIHMFQDLWADWPIPNVPNVVNTNTQYIQCQLVCSFNYLISS